MLDNMRLRAARVTRNEDSYMTIFFQPDGLTWIEIEDWIQLNLPTWELISAGPNITSEEYEFMCEEYWRNWNFFNGKDVTY